MAKRIVEERRRRQDLAGIPESRRFGGDPAAEDNPVLDCHVGGVLVRDLPQEAQNRIVYQQTDEGIAAANEGKSESRVSVVSEGFDKALLQRREDLSDRGMEPYEARDPLKEVADAHAKPGFRPKFLSARRIQENGGTGDYEVVKDAKGDPVKVKGMILGQVPEPRARARNRHYQNKSAALLKQITRKYTQEGGQTAVADQ